MPVYRAALPVSSGFGICAYSQIPGSKNVRHIKDNLDILDFKLTDEEMAEIANLDKGERYYHRTDEQLAGFAAWRPDFEKA